MSIVKQYQAFTKTTAMYNPNEPFNYLIPGLCSESGEVAGAWKKYVREDYGDVELEDRLRDEIGDVLWYVSEICNTIGVDMEDIMVQSIGKLEARKRKGLIHGDGDERK